MPFWRDLKKIGVSSVKAVSNGVELLGALADEAERVSHAKVLRGRGERLERELALLQPDPGGNQLKGEKIRELLAVYDELIEVTADSPDQAVVSRKARLVAQLRQDAAQRLAAEIAELELSIAGTSFSLPIEEIRRKRTLMGKLDTLHAQLDEGVERKRVSDKRQKLVEDIARLETLRASAEVTEFPSGSIASRIERYDGVRHGVSEYWYANGQLRLRLPFVRGRVYGRIGCWREDGSLLFEGVRNADGAQLTGYLRNGARALYGEFASGGHLDLWLDGKVYAGRLWVDQGQVSKSGFLLGLLCKPRVWHALWKARRPGSARDVLNESIAVMDQFANFNQELADMSRE